jgi:rod shape determining protein RodA
MKIQVTTAFDYPLMFSMISLIGVGTAFIYSSGTNEAAVNISSEYVKHIMFAVSGFVLLSVTAALDYRRAYCFTPYAYLGLLAALAYTAFFGHYVSGTRAWLGVGNFGIQPSEFGKIVFILTLACYLERSASYPPFQRFLSAFFLLLFPFALILFQSDFGTAIVYIPIFLSMCFIAKTDFRFLIVSVLIATLSFVFAILPIWESEILQKPLSAIQIFRRDNMRFFVAIAASGVTLVSIIGWLAFKNKYYLLMAYFFGIVAAALLLSSAVSQMLKSYQIKRLVVFFDPTNDIQGAGWNIRQSKFAIRSGGLWGRGFLKGTQNQFLPKQSTDFIFSGLAEEWGFAGCIVICALYFFILARTLLIVKNTADAFGRYIATGIFGLFFFHFAVNVGMVMGLIPVVGIPLPFLSYGGSFLWTTMICVGLLMSINYRCFDVRRLW